MSLSRLALAGVALLVSAAPSLALDPLKPLDATRFHTPEEQFLSSLPRDTTGRYPRPERIGRTLNVPVGAYLPVPPNAFNLRRSYAPGEAAVVDVKVRRGRLVDAKGRATRDRRHGTAWGGEAGARRAIVEQVYPE